MEAREYERNWHTSINLKHNLIITKKKKRLHLGEQLSICSVKTDFLTKTVILRTTV